MNSKRRPIPTPIWPAWTNSNEPTSNLREQIARVIVGQDEVIEQLLIGIFARGHCILEGVPGLAKTLMVSTLAECLSLDFNRIQFTPDLMPSDITGTEVLAGRPRDRRTRSCSSCPGRSSPTCVLADEINRTPPKTQAALLEAMQERQVTAGGHRHPLPDPFFVLATQNPIEQEGTYPLPEAQLDRFLFKVFVGYPTPDEERQIYRLTTGIETHERDQGAVGRRDSRRCRRWCGGCRFPIIASTTRWRLVRATRTDRAGQAGLRRQVDRLGRRPARRPVADPGRQGPRRARRAAPASRSRTFAPWRTPCCGIAW